MVRIPSGTIRQEAPPALVSQPGTGEQRAGEVVKLDADEGGAVSVVVPAGVMVEASNAVAEEGPEEGPVERGDAAGIPPAPEPAPVADASPEPPPPQAPSVPVPADDRTAFKVVLALKPADEGRWAEQPRNATAPLRIGGVKPETAIGGATPASKRKTPADEQHSAADRGSAAEDAGRRGNCKANQPTNDNDRAARRRHGKSAATASVSKVAATVVDGGVEKLRLF